MQLNLNGKSIEIPDERNGKILVTRVTVAADCGLVVNPSGAALQAKGSVVRGLSSTLIEKIVL
jgi:isoquinoline 1-oxidoreductase subunit beta